MRLRDKLNPKILCRKHLLGEHVEYHKILETSVKKNKSMTGYIDVRAISYLSVFRHDEIVREMIRRGYNHQSPRKIKPIHFLIYCIKYNIPVVTYEKENLRMLLQGYITKNGLYKPACKECRDRYISLLKGKML